MAETTKKLLATPIPSKRPHSSYAFNTATSTVAKP